MSDTQSRLLTKIESDPAFADAVLGVRAAKETSAMLRGMRIDAGLTQAELARKLSVSQARISQVEGGLLDHLPPLDFIYRFAAACGRQVSMTVAPRDTPQPGAVTALKTEIDRDLNRVLEAGRTASVVMTEYVDKISVIVEHISLLGGPSMLPSRSSALARLIEARQRLEKLQQAVNEPRDFEAQIRRVLTEATRAAMKNTAGRGDGRKN